MIRSMRSAISGVAGAVGKLRNEGDRPVAIDGINGIGSVARKENTPFNFMNMKILFKFSYSCSIFPILIKGLS